MTVISRVIRKGTHGALWYCICDCGKSIETTSYSLRLGYTKSCGCLANKFMDKTLSSKNALFSSYKKGAEKRGIKFELSFDDFIKLIQGNCYYCNKSPESIFRIKYAQEGFVHNGIDRLNSGGNYSLDNVVSCCPVCNRLKWDRNKDEFINWIEKCFYRLKLGEFHES